MVIQELALGHALNLTIDVYNSTACYSLESSNSFLQCRIIGVV